MIKYTFKIEPGAAVLDCTISYNKRSVGFKKIKSFIKKKAKLNGWKSYYVYKNLDGVSPDLQEEFYSIVIMGADIPDYGGEFWYAVR